MSEQDRRLLPVSATANFRSFGMGQTSNNPIAMAMQDKPPQFAAGVDVREVVDHIVNNIEVIEAGKGEASARGESDGKGMASAALKAKILENIGAASAASRAKTGGIRCRSY